MGDGLKDYRIPVRYSVEGFITIAANTLDEACNIAEESEMLLEDCEIVDNTWRVDWKNAPKYNKED